ncbi:proline racemase family protein [Chitinophaga nivalis]|uniref:Proline racemase family protein n=1 Tax=Chitinophaga nivalis TaxID=2991709 RepID=A0ABT3IMK6_9BACT|nr:proline racemase family protein [Chitinophaga nivalis]MCW3465135.1 proline racemase family protein [Chitinophaga nivalis]MCW3485173.1 proline racemase family protein [Chitinophaga nivalis]
MQTLLNNLHWEAPAQWLKIETIDMHTGGEPLRVFIAGLPAIKGETVLEKRRYFKEHLDFIRTGTMWEPRGHADMYGAVISTSTDADMDVFFLHNEGYSTMCGHAILALTKLVLETGMIKKEGPYPELTINVPAGKIYARATMENGLVSSVSFRNVPSFLYLSDQEVMVPGIGNVKFDVAYGGAFYAFVNAEDLQLELTAPHYNQLIDYGRRIKNAVMDNFSIRHPFEEDLSFLYGTIFTGAALEKEHHSRNVCIFAEGEVDRSATGSGVSARAALHHAKGELKINETIVIESITGSTMGVTVRELTTFGDHNAVIPEVSGTAFITGRHTFYFDPEDPFKKGFIFR